MITGSCTGIGMPGRGPKAPTSSGGWRQGWEHDCRQVSRRANPGSWGWHYFGCDCPWPAPRHEETELVLHGQRILVDTAITALISELNAGELITQFSCQGDRHTPGYVIVLSQDPAVIGRAALIAARLRGWVQLKPLTGNFHMPEYGPRTLLSFPGEDAIAHQNLAMH